MNELQKTASSRRDSSHKNKARVLTEPTTTVKP
jgi:serine/threonine protein kinase